MDLGSFVRGAAEAGSEDLRQRRDLALQLKLKNRLIEMEIGKAQQLYDYQKATPQATQALGEQFGISYAPGQRVSVADEGLGYLAGIQRAGISAQARKPGSEVKIPVWAQKEQYSKSNGYALLKQMRDLRKRAVLEFGSGPLKGRVANLVQAAEQGELYPTVAAYVRFVTGNLPGIARASGEAGQLANRDIDRAAKLVSGLEVNDKASDAVFDASMSKLRSEAERLEGLYPQLAERRRQSGIEFDTISNTDSSKEERQEALKALRQALREEKNR